MQKELAPSNNTSVDRNCTLISATWDPTEPSFESLNIETPKDVKQFMTVAVDLVIRGIQEPVRFQIETAVRIFGQSERNFWYFQKRSLVQQFFLNLKEVNGTITCLLANVGEKIRTSDKNKVMVVTLGVISKFLTMTEMCLSGFNANSLLRLFVGRW